MSTNWAFQLRAANEHLTLEIYDSIGKDPLFGGGISAQEIVAKLREAPKAKEILVRINSAGGLITDGLAIYNLLRQTGAAVTCRVDALAGSIASIIAMAGATVEMAEHSFLMIHNPYGTVEGGAGELRNQAAVLDTMREEMLAIYCAKSGQPRDVVAKMCDDETWMTAAQALRLGFCDRVIPDSNAKLAAQLDLSAFRNTPRSIDAGRIEDAQAQAIGAAVARIESGAVTVNSNLSPGSIAEAVHRALAELANNNVTLGSSEPDSLETGAVDPAPTGEATMAMTEEESKKLADLEAENTTLKAALTSEQGARASAEEALAKAKKKAEFPDDEEEDEDEEKMAAKAVVTEAMELTGCKDISKLCGALSAVGVKLKAAGKSVDSHANRVSRLIAQGKLLPAMKAKALAWSPAQLDGFLETMGDAKFGPVGEEHTPDETADEVAKARAATKAPVFNAEAIQLTAEEKKVATGMGVALDKCLADKVARAKAEHQARYGNVAA